MLKKMSLKDCFNNGMMWSMLSIFSKRTKKCYPTPYG